MEETASHLIVEPQQVLEGIMNLDPQLLQEELEYLRLKSDFFDGQTEVWGKLIHEQELKNKVEEQKLIEVLNEREIQKKKLIGHLKALKEQVVTKSSKRTTKIISKNGFFECSECTMKSKWKNSVICHIKSIHRKVNKLFNCPECHYKSNRTFDLNYHINAVHRNLRPYKCSDCNKGLSVKIICI